MFNNSQKQKNRILFTQNPVSQIKEKIKVLFVRFLQIKMGDKLN